MARMPDVKAVRGEVAEIVKAMIEEDMATRVVVRLAGSDPDRFIIEETVPD